MSDARLASSASSAAWEVETAIVEHLEKVWNEPGSDIWQSRGEKRRYTLSQALACVGIERFIEGELTRQFANAGWSTAFAA